MRISTLFSVLSVAILGVATLFGVLGHCIRGHKMLVASGLYCFGGLILGTGLIIFMCVLSDEFGSNPSSNMASPSLYHPDKTAVPWRVHYSYGWSFILAALAFLAAEFAAALCLSAFLNRFDNEEEFVKMIPGMERRMLEHSYPRIPPSCSDQSQVDVPLLKGSFGHHAPAVTSEETLCRIDGSVHVVQSDSVHSIIGLTKENSIVKAEVVHDGAVNLADIPLPEHVIPPPPMIEDEQINNGGNNIHNNIHNNMHNSIHISPPPPCSHLENGGLMDGHYTFQELNPPRTAQIHSVNSRVKTMPRGSSNHHTERKNSVPTNHAEHHRSVVATATMPRHQPGINGRKKKSVTIGTFTTMETFDSGFSSAV